MKIYKILGFVAALATLSCPVSSLGQANVKPGITGEWQVRGRSSVKDFEEVVKLDLRYQRRWTPWYDLVIICQTLYVVVTKIGAC